MKRALDEGTFASRLTARMHELALSWGELARGLSVPKSTVQGWVQGTGRPEGETLALLAQHIGLSPVWLKTGEGERAGRARRRLSALEAHTVALRRREADLNAQIKDVRKQRREREAELSLWLDGGVDP